MCEQWGIKGRGARKIVSREIAERVTTGGTGFPSRRGMVGQSINKQNKIVHVSNFKQIPTPAFHSLSVIHNFYFSAEWFVYTYGVSSSQKYQHLHRTRKQSSQKCFERSTRAIVQTVLKA